MTPELLEERRSRIFSTDITRLVGLGFDQQGAMDVYREKVYGYEPRQVETILEIGNATELLNAKLFTEKTGLLLRRKTLKLDAEYEWIGSSFDFETAINKDIVETKYAFFPRGWGEEGTDQMPDRYLIQTNWQMGCDKTEHVYVPLLLGDGSHFIYQNKLNKRLLEILRQIAKDFWDKHIVPRIEPTEWNHPLLKAIGRQLVPVIKGKTISLPIEHRESLHKFVELKQIEKTAKEEADLLKAEIEIAIGNAEVAKCGDFQIKRSEVKETKISYTRKAYTTLKVRAVNAEKPEEDENE